MVQLIEIYRLADDRRLIKLLVLVDHDDLARCSVDGERVLGRLIDLARGRA